MTRRASFPRECNGYLWVPENLPEESVEGIIIVNGRRYRTIDNGVYRIAIGVPHFKLGENRYSLYEHINLQTAPEQIVRPYAIAMIGNGHFTHEAIDHGRNVFERELNLEKRTGPAFPGVLIDVNNPDRYVVSRFY